MHADNKFKPLIDKVKGKLEVIINYANPLDNVTEI